MVALRYSILFICCLVAPISVAGEIWDHKALLWKAVSAEGKESFILGTMHSEDPRITTLADPVKQAFESASAFAAEIDISAAGDQLKAMMLDESKSLKSMMSTAQYSQSMQACRDFGLIEMICSKLTPWGLALTVSMPKPKTGMFLDLMLYYKAKHSGKEVLGLERADQSVEVFVNMSDAEHVEFLAETLKQLPEKDALIEIMHEQYLARDLPAMSALAMAEFRKLDSKLADKILDGLLVKRNKRFVENAMPWLKQGRFFMAIGAMHLPGEEGVLNLLHEQGWAVTPVY